MPKALLPTTALLAAMCTVLILALLLSSRTHEGQTLVRDRVFPLIERLHPPGAGTFRPGSFLANFFLPSLVLMVALNMLLPSLWRPLSLPRVNVFYYMLGLVVAILEVGADTILPSVALPERWGLGLAVTMIHGGFVLSLALAVFVAAGAEKEW